ncbi:thioredoxin TrxA [Variovorax defluvii]|uniref:Thioredoxin n=1 Tax=Variovorax defluvii TaxID=913761 RepID=A0ABP8GVV3_9BURK
MAEAITPTGAGSADLDALLARQAGPVLVDCYSPGCGPCAALAPVLDELSHEFEGQLAIEKVDVAAQPEVAMRFGIRSVPTLLLFQDGKLKASRTGGASRAQLLTWLSAQHAF